jgi:CRISPR/Cas system CSM-associated protein Csm3 (group 7 of RAMP superfamily)
MTITGAPADMAADGREPATRSVSLLTFTLRLTEPGGVTVPGKTGRDAAGERHEPQAVLDTGPDGRPHLPGTSLAGALRNLVSGVLGGDVADAWFGRLLPQGSGGADVDAQASRIWVLGSRLLGDEPVTVLASTRIDRWRGAAADNTLRAEQVLPAGAGFEVFLRWDGAGPGEVASLAELIARWRPLIGRGTSRGRGRCVTERVRHGTLRLDDPGDLLTWLTLSGPDLVLTAASHEVQAPGTGPDPDLLLQATASIDGPWRIGTGETPPKGEKIPLLRAGGRPVVPGSAVKGLLRSRAEYILRSVGVTPDPCPDGTCQLCWTCQVFGYGGGDSEETSVGSRAAVRIADAVVANPVDAERIHIAIDRFTGGVLDGALYMMEVLEAGTFPLRVERLAAGLDAQREKEIRAVLRLVLEDLNDGIIGMGGAAARGYGSVTVDFGRASGLPEAGEARRVLAQLVEGGTYGTP